MRGSEVEMQDLGLFFSFALWVLLFLRMPDGKVVAISMAEAFWSFLFPETTE